MTNQFPHEADAFAQLFGPSRGRRVPAQIVGAPRARRLAGLAALAREGDFDAVLAALRSAPRSSLVYPTVAGLLACTLAERLAAETRDYLLWSAEAFRLGELHPMGAETLVNEPLCSFLLAAVSADSSDDLSAIEGRAQYAVVVGALSTLSDEPRRRRWLELVLGNRLPELRATMLEQPDASEMTVDEALSYAPLDGVFALMLPAWIGVSVDWPPFVALLATTLCEYHTHVPLPF